MTLAFDGFSPTVRIPGIIQCVYDDNGQIQSIMFFNTRLIEDWVINNLTVPENYRNHIGLKIWLKNNKLLVSQNWKGRDHGSV